MERAVQDAKNRQGTERYIPSARACQSIKCSPLFLSRITSTLTLVTGPKEHVEVGLGLKYSRKGLAIPGYARRVEVAKRPGTFRWEYSNRAVRLLTQFKGKFPDFCRGVERDPAADAFFLASTFVDSAGSYVEDPENQLTEMLQWLRNCETSKFPLLPCASDALRATVVQSLEVEAQRLVAYDREPIVLAEVAACELLQPLRLAMASPAKHAWALGDRVINIRGSGAAPVGLKGTLISLHKSTAEVLFDRAFLAGAAVDGKCTDTRILSVPLWGLLSLSHKRFCVPKTVAQKALGRAAPKKKKKQSKAISTGQTSNPFALLMGE
jgi:5'-3' exoribonuclease 1